jgi:GT2 family glycosyltransferase
VDATVIIPTFNRRTSLVETLGRLEKQRTGFSYEVIVIDDGSTDDIVEIVRAFVANSPLQTTFLQQQKSGPASARNKGIDAASGDICLLLGDDIWCHPDLLARHIGFHRRHAADEIALLGRIVWAESGPTSVLMDWLVHTGVQFGYNLIEDPQDVSPCFFYASNISLKTRFLRAHGGFDERFRDAAFEDVELGLRLREAGLKLVYDPEAVAEHFHPVDLPQTLERMRRVGRATVLLRECFPEWPQPLQQTGWQTRVKAAWLTALNLMRLRTRATRFETWGFLCRQALSDGFWMQPASTGTPLTIGRRLALVAARDPATEPALPNFRRTQLSSRFLSSRFSRNA